MNIAVIGIGQPLRGDDGIGPAAVRRWSDDPRPAPGRSNSIRVEFFETPGLELIDHLQNCDAAILVDAVSTGRPAGTVSVFPAMPETGITSAEKSAHGFGVAETLALARRSGAHLPESLILIGVEGKQFRLGEGLSEPVRSALPHASAAITREVTAILSTKYTKEIRSTSRK
jgi:hydrogenase maturation protease